MPGVVFLFTIVVMTVPPPRTTAHASDLLDWFPRMTLASAATGLEDSAPLRTLYVAATGSDSNSGTAASPWRTPQYAANQAQAGDLIILRAGSYAGFVIPVSGTAAHRLTFRGEPGATISSPVSFGGGIYGVNASGQSFLTLEGLTFAPQAGQARWYAAIRLGGKPKDWAVGNIIRNNVVQMRQVNIAATPDKYGLYASWQDGLLVAGNAISGGYNSGIYVTNSAKNYIIRGNTVADVGGNGIHNNGDASQGGPGINVNALIEGNIIHHVGYGIGGQAISCDGVQNSRIRNNLIYDAAAKGIALYVTNAAAPSRNNLVVNNTVVTVGSGAPLRINVNCSGNTVVNNIFVAATATGGWIDGEESGLVGSTIDYNVTFGVAKVGGVTRADWKTTYGFDLHSLVATPATLFLNAAEKDFQLKAGSKAIRAGTSRNAPAHDLVGTERPKNVTPDIGAYKHAR